MSKKKLLFCASYPNQPIGYSVVANTISNFFAEEGIDVYYFGFSNVEIFKVPRYIHPNIKFIDVMKEEKMIEEGFGTTIIQKYIDEINPDHIFIYNDLIVVYRILFAITKVCKITIYLDLVYPYERIELLEYVFNHASTVLVFSDYWKKNLCKILS